MEIVTSLFGRFHPLLVHLPIGFLFLAFLFECLSARPQYRGLRKAVAPALLWGSVFAVASALSGYMLRQEGGYEEDLVNLHQNFGIATAVLSLAVYFVRRRTKVWIADPWRRKKARILILLPLVLLLAITGHFGGSLTHGADYLFSAASRGEARPDPAERIRAIANVPDAILYRDVVQPILESRCYDCHSSSKEKGDLRLDGTEFIMRGGKHGSIIGEGPADSSTLFKRLMLPLEDEHHMPPEEKPQLSSSEIALMKYWIEGNAAFTEPVDSFPAGKKIATIIRSLQENPRGSWIPREDVAAADEKSLTALAAAGITPLPLANGSHYLMVTFAGTPDVTDEQLKSLQGVRDQLVWLNLNHTHITDAQLTALSTLSNIRVLYLNNTAISDAGLTSLAPLTRLTILSVVGTAISDASLPVLQKFKDLTSLYLYRTAITPKGIAELAAGRKELKVDTGNYVLEPLPTDTIVYKMTSR